MNIWARRVLLAIFVMTPIACAALSRVADAVVTERDGLPCFATSDPSAMRGLHAVIVSDTRKNGVRVELNEIHFKGINTT
jgi:hypothetical protein